jgi:hypothetical protein
MEWRRIHFFKGFFTHAEDWQAAQAYRNAKHQLHNRAMHGWGIVSGHLKNLEVSVSADGTALIVEPGLAIDREGRELYLSEPETIPFEPQAHHPGSHIYLIARYDEELVDRRENVANPEYSGHAFIRESTRIELTGSEPGENNAVELARVHLSRDATRLRMPADPAAPRENEVDRRHRHHAGVASGTGGRALWHEIAHSITDGQISVSANNSSDVSIEEVHGDDPLRFYLASCNPLTEARVSWRIISNRDARGRVEYTLNIENFEGRDVEVRFHVYRLG